MKIIIFPSFLTLLIFLTFQTSSFGATKRCLFIGDSYFSHNDLSKELVTAWHEVTTDTLLVTNHNRDGTTIDRQWKYEPAELQSLLESQKWDYVIIELPRLATPQDSSLVELLHKVDVSLRNCSIICISIDFCFSFPEMACTKDPVEGVICNEFRDCTEKLTYVSAMANNIVHQKYRNSIQVIPFPHYRYFLQDQYSIELGSDDDFGHPSPFSQSVLARFILFHIMNAPSEVKDTQANHESMEDIHISSFYKAYYHENDK